MRKLWCGSAELVVRAWLFPPKPGSSREGQGVPLALGWPGWAGELVLTLDVDGDRCLLPSGDGFVGGSAHDTLAIFHIARGDEEGAHDALTLAISKQGLGEQGEKAPCHLAGTRRGLGKTCPGLREEALSSGHPGVQVSAGRGWGGVSRGSLTWLSPGLQQEKGTRRSSIM